MTIKELYEWAKENKVEDLQVFRCDVDYGLLTPSPQIEKCTKYQWNLGDDENLEKLIQMARKNEELEIHFVSL